MRRLSPVCTRLVPVLLRLSPGMSRFNKVCAGYSWLNYPSLNKKVCKVKIICLVAVYSPRLLVSCNTDVTPG